MKYTVYASAIRYYETVIEADSKKEYEDELISIEAYSLEENQ